QHFLFSASAPPYGGCGCGCKPARRCSDLLYGKCRVVVHIRQFRFSSQRAMAGSNGRFRTDGSTACQKNPIAKCLSTPPSKWFPAGHLHDVLSPVLLLPFFPSLPKNNDSVPSCTLAVYCRLQRLKSP